MLIDRTCPGGGWNAGNGVVYGSALAPHPDDTAVALLALNNRTQHPVVHASVKWLERTAPTLTAPWSLAWAILALAAHGRAVGSLISRFSLFLICQAMTTPALWRLSVLLLITPRALAALGVNL